MSAPFEVEATGGVVDGPNEKPVLAFGAADAAPKPNAGVVLVLTAAPEPRLDPNEKPVLFLPLLALDPNPPNGDDAPGEAAAPKENEGGEPVPKEVAIGGEC